MNDKIVYVLFRKNVSFRQIILMSMYMLMGYKVKVLKPNQSNTCRGYRANMVINDYLDFNCINTDEILK